MHRKPEEVCGELKREPLKNPFQRRNGGGRQVVSTLRTSWSELESMFQFPEKMTFPFAFECLKCHGFGEEMHRSKVVRLCLCLYGKRDTAGAPLQLLYIYRQFRLFLFSTLCVHAGPQLWILLFFPVNECLMFTRISSWTMETL